MTNTLVSIGYDCLHPQNTLKKEKNKYQKTKGGLLVIPKIKNPNLHK